MPITSSNPFKGRHFPGEVILVCICWHLRYPLATNTSLNSWRNVAWTWTQLHLALGAGLRTRAQQTLAPTSEADEHNYRTDETNIKVKGEDKYLNRAVDSTGQTIDFLLSALRDGAAAKR